MKKLIVDIFSQIQLVLVDEIETQIPIDYLILNIDFSLVKPPLNTQKYLAHVNLPEHSLKILFDNLGPSPVLQLLGTSKKTAKKVLTKLKVVIVKQFLDVSGWNEVMKLLYDKKNQKV